MDLDSPQQARRVLDALPGLRWAKVGPMLLLAGGWDLVAELKGRGIRVFLDLKWHDIPHAVAGAVAAAARLGVDLVTVHALGGEEMVRAAVAARGKTRVAGVTVLTSHSAASLAAALGRPTVELAGEVERLARMLLAAGVDAVVTSPEEIGVVRSVAGPDTWIVVPGIRPPFAEVGDQRRTATPEAAVAAGATHLVVGRPIVRAKDPQKVYQGLCDAIG